MDSNTGAPAATLSVGSIISRTWGTLMKKPGVYLGICFVFGLVATLINVGLTLANPMLGSLLGNIISMIINLLGGAAIVYVAFQDLRDVRMGLKEALIYVSGRLVPLFLVALLSGLGIGIGMLLLVVPGIFLACIWIVAVPACVVEKLGPVDCLRRSMELTKGYRLTIFGALVVIVAAFIIFGAIATFLGGAVLTMTTSIAVMALTAALLSLVLTLIPSAMLTLITAILYADLRSAKEGISKESLAEVFD